MQHAHWRHTFKGVAEIKWLSAKDLKALDEDDSDSDGSQAEEKKAADHKEDKEMK